MKRKRAFGVACLAVLAAAGAWVTHARWSTVIWRRLRPGRLFPVLIDGKVGYIDVAGRLLVPARFDPACDPQIDAFTMASPDAHVDWRIRWAKDFHEGRCAVQIGGRMGHIDTQGRLVSRELFESVEDFRDGVARVRRGRSYGLIDRDGRTVVESVFDRLDEFRRGLAWARRRGKSGIVDTAGRWVLEPQFQCASRRFDGFSIVREARTWGAVDDRGRIVLPARFKRVHVWPNAITVLDDRCKWGVTDRRGRWVLRPFAQGLGRGFSEGLLAARMSGKWGYVDRSGTVVIGCRFDSAGEFSEGLAAVSKAGLLGYVDRSGSIVIDLKFEKAERFSGGMARVRNGGLWGCIQRDGQFVIPPTYDGIGPFGGGIASAIRGGGRDGRRRQTGRSWGDWGDLLCPDLAVVERWGKWGIIDREGKLRTPPVLDGEILRQRGLAFSEGRARVVQDGKVGFVDCGGRMAIRPRFDRAESFSGGLARVMVWDQSPHPQNKVVARWGYIDRYGQWVWKPTR